MIARIIMGLFLFSGITCVVKSYDNNSYLLYFIGFLFVTLYIVLTYPVEIEK